MGVKLILRQQSLLPTVGTCGVSQLAYPVFAGLKWLDIALPRYIALRRSRSVDERYAGTGAAGRAAAVAADAALLGHRGVLSAWRALRTAGLRCEPVARMGAHLDSLLADPRARVQAHRSSAWVNWLLENRFDDDPRRRQGLFYVRDGHGRVVAYFVAKCAFYEAASHQAFRDVLLGSLQDWTIFEPERVDFAQLVLFAAQAMGRWDVDAIEVCLPPDTAGAGLARLGFRRVGDLHLLVRAPEAPADPRAWWVRPADGDNFFS
jgi:hypothetical protein